MRAASVFSPLDELDAAGRILAAHQLSILFRHRAALGPSLTLDRLLEHAAIGTAGVSADLHKRLRAVVHSLEKLESMPLEKIADGTLLKYQVELEASVSRKLRAAYGLTDARGEEVLAELRNDPLTPARQTTRTRISGKVSAIEASDGTIEQTERANEMEQDLSKLLVTAEG